MQKTYLLLTTLICLCSCLNAQNLYNQKWIIGNYILFDFSAGGAPIITLEQPLMDLGPGDHTNTICDKNGNLIFYTGGCFIGNRKHEIMMNGDSINSSYIYQIGLCKYGDFPMLNSNIILPFPDDEQRYIILNLDQGPKIPTSIIPLSHHLLYQVVDMTLDGGLGGVVQKNAIAIDDYLDYGSVAAVKHTNGRDWWVVVPQFNSNCYYVLPITPQGVGIPVLQCMGFEFGNLTGGGQASFSPDGKKYARIEADNALMFMQFDAEQGVLSDALQLDYNKIYSYFHGANFSGNSRYLYITTDESIYQFDTDANDIQSTVTWVGGMRPDTLQQGQGAFGPMMLATNGRMYMSCTGLGRWFSSIERPNCPGLACDARVHKIYLPSTNYDNNNTQPHFAIPQQDFNCDANSADEPRGAYQLTLWPNPALEKIMVNLPVRGRVYIRALDGRVLSSQEVSEGPCSISLHLPQGMYLLEYHEQKGRVVVERFVVGE
jgi:hypothetical protein